MAQTEQAPPELAAPGRDVIVIGASAGGVEALVECIKTLPADLPAAIFVVLHMSPYHRSYLPAILNRQGQLHAVQATQGARFERGHVYVAPPDHHMLVRDGFIELSRGPRENRTRPAIDPLFRSAARSYGERVIAIVLSGMLGDGALGLTVVKSYGGVTIVQDPGEARFGSMPATAIQAGAADHVLALVEIAPLIVQMVNSPGANGGKAMEHSAESQSKIIQRDMSAQAQNERVDEISAYTCPDCGGILWQIHGDQQMRFECHVGHLYAPEYLLVQKSEQLEDALWSAVRLLGEKLTLTRQTATRLREAGDEGLAARIEEQGELDEQYIRIIRERLLEATPNPISQGFVVADLAHVEQGEGAGPPPQPSP